MRKKKQQETPQQRRRRYALHHKLKSHGYTVMARQKTIKVPDVRSQSIMGSKAWEHAKKLASLGYNVQTYIQ